MIKAIEQVVSEEISAERLDKYEALANEHDRDPRKIYNAMADKFAENQCADNYALMQACMLALQQNDVEIGAEEL